MAEAEEARVYDFPRSQEEIEAREKVNGEYFALCKNIEMFFEAVYEKREQIKKHENEVREIFAFVEFLKKKMIFLKSKRIEDKAINIAYQKTSGIKGIKRDTNYHSHEYWLLNRKERLLDGIDDDVEFLSGISHYAKTEEISQLVVEIKIRFHSLLSFLSQNRDFHAVLPEEDSEILDEEN